jgi:hypothetical protein
MRQDPSEAETKAGVSTLAPLACEASMVGAPIQKTLPILLARKPRFLRLWALTYFYSLNIGMLYGIDPLCAS